MKGKEMFSFVNNDIREPRNVVAAAFKVKEFHL